MAARHGRANAQTGCFKNCEITARIKALGWLKKKEDEATVNQFLVSGHCNATTVTRAGGLLIVNCTIIIHFFITSQ